MPRENILGTTISEDNGIGVIYLEGELIADSRFDAERILRRWLDKGILQVIISCGKLKYLDSAGLSMMLAQMHRFRRHEGDLILAEMNPSLSAIFEVTSMHKYFNIFDNIDDARKHFEQAGEQKKKQASRKATAKKTKSAKTTQK